MSPATYRRCRWGLILILLAAFSTGAYAAPATQPSPPDAILADVTAKGPLLLHLPGIAGTRRCDDRMLAGLRGGGVQANFVIDDWTGDDPGINALQSYAVNHAKAQTIADLIVAHAHANPSSPIYLTAHSGGCAMAIWALEDLPPSVKVQTLLLMAPALSPRYDLTKALRHVKGNAYAFTSTLDTVVLSTGTTLFGTMDGVQTPAAGFGGFIQPPTADADIYRKLIQRPYEPDWAKYGDYGEHIGAMARRFSQAVLAPLIVNSDSPPSTRPGSLAERSEPEGAHRVGE